MKQVIFAATVSLAPTTCAATPQVTADLSRLDLGRNANGAGTREWQSNVCRQSRLLANMTILGLNLTGQARADRTQLGIQRYSCTSDVVRLRAAEAAASADDNVAVALSKLGSPFLPFGIRSHEAVVDRLEEGSLELAEILGRKS